MKTLLHEGWTVRATAGPVPGQVRGRQLPAAVPGVVTLDLMAAGLVPDPYLDDNELAHGWIARTCWSYQTTFATGPLAEGERLDLVCAGLDTVATIRVNGTVIGSTANMHRTYRFDLRDALAAGSNTLTVDFKAPLDAAEELSEAIGPRPRNGAHPFNAIRKMACNYGWDWGPDLPTVGIWRSIWLHRWERVRIAAVRPLTAVELPRSGEPDAGSDPRAADATSPRKAAGTADVYVDLEWADPGDSPVSLTAAVAGTETTIEVEPGSATATARLTVPSVELWWPAGYGAQPLYDLDVAVWAAAADREETGRVADRWRSRVGFRSVELDTRPDERGARLGFVLNGRAIQVRGANWIPDDCFPSRITAQRYRGRLEQARDANINLIRIWGGGIFESQDFYDAADELGILVWQDFLLACAAYAEEEPLRGEITHEARQAVTMLSRHPCRAVWSGGNENIWGHEDWGWKEPLGAKTWGARYYYETFPATVAELDPMIPYMAGSPWSLGYDVHPNDPRYGSMHVWDVWNQKDYPRYRDHQPQFVAEFGFQGPPTWSTLTRSVTRRPLRTDSPLLAAHQKGGDGMGKLERSLAAHFPVPASARDWHWATSLNQARAVAFGIEYWRSLTPACRGTIVWQLNDCWPAISWSVIDGDGHLKPSWYALRRAYADRLLTVQPLPGNGGLAAVAVNDGSSPWTVRASVTRQDFFGTVQASAMLEVTALPGQRALMSIPADLASPGRAAEEVLVVEGQGERALWFFSDDEKLMLPEPSVSARVEAAPDGYNIVLQASSLQRDVAVLADRLDPDAVCDDMLITLLPGESRSVRVRSARRLDPQALVGPFVLRSANQLAHPESTPESED
jgi:beta-mannosidase